MKQEMKELSALFSDIHAHYGVDFRNYSMTCLGRRVDWFMQKERLSNLAMLKHQVLEDGVLFSRFRAGLSLGVTQMFRDPEVFKYLREVILPRLAPFPFLRFWSAGTSTGEEAYSLAILLEEAGLYNRSLIYATDHLDHRLKRAGAGFFPLRDMARHTRNYYDSGGKTSFSQYFRLEGEWAIIDRRLRRNMVVSPHCIASDGVFNQFHLILCRNVLIYFNAKLKERALTLFTESLMTRGFLCLGSKESLISLQANVFYEKINEKERIFRKLS